MPNIRYPFDMPQLGAEAKRRCQSALWAKDLEALGPVAPRACWLSVADRAPDVYGHLIRARAQGWHCLIRACQD